MRASWPARISSVVLLLSGLAAAVGPGCSNPGATYLVIEVAGPAGGVTRLAVTLGNAEWPAETQAYDLEDRRLPASLSVELPATLSGELQLDVAGLDPAGATLASGGRAVVIRAGEINRTRVDLGAAPPDGGPPGDVRDGGPDGIDGPDGSDGDGPGPDDGSAPDVPVDGPGPDGADGPPDGMACGDTSQDPSNCGACGHSCRGGACRDGLCQPVVVATGQARPFALAVDATHVYWTNVDDSTVKRAGLAGGAPEDLATEQPAPTGIAVDDLGVYWLNYGDGAVMRTLPGQTPSLLVDGPRSPVALAFDGTTLFWITEGAAGSLSSAPRTGAPSATPLVGQLNGARDLAVDGSSVYMTINDTGEIWRIAKDGSSSAQTLLTNQGDPIGIAVFEGLVYWCNRTSGNVRSVPVAGGVASTLVASGQDRPFAVAADASGVYWVNYGDGRVMQLPPGAQTPRMLAQGPVAARDLVLDATSVHWITEGDLQNDGSVMTVVKPAP